MKSQVIQALVDCFKRCDGAMDGFDFSDEPWTSLQPEIDTVTKDGFVFRLGNGCYRVTVSTISEGPGK